MMALEMEPAVVDTQQRGRQEVAMPPEASGDEAATADVVPPDSGTMRPGETVPAENADIVADLVQQHGAAGYCYLPNLSFTNRNRAYGAYPLRKYYRRRLLLALAIGVTVFVTGVSGPRLYKALRLERAVSVDLSQVVELKELEEPPPLDENQPPPPPPVEAPPPPKIATVRFVPPVVAADEEVAEEIPPTQEEMKTAQAATLTQEGDPNADPNEILEDFVVEEDRSAAEVVGTPLPSREETEVFIVVEEMPQVIGGTQAVYKHLEYPPVARMAGIEGMVVVQFVVNTNGEPVNLEVVRSAAPPLDEAALAAVEKLRFIPGKQRGTPVRVKMAIPIRFRLKDITASPRETDQENR
jgi:protein TonB